MIELTALEDWQYYSKVWEKLTYVDTETNFSTPEHLNVTNRKNQRTVISAKGFIN